MFCVQDILRLGVYFGYVPTMNVKFLTGLVHGCFVSDFYYVTRDCDKLYYINHIHVYFPSLLITINNLSYTLFS